MYKLIKSKFIFNSLNSGLKFHTVIRQNIIFSSLDIFLNSIFQKK